MKRSRRWISSAFVLVCLLLAVPRASASLITVGIGAFPMGSTLTTFTGLALETEVNGLTVDGILFQYSLGNGRVAINVGPNTTPNINQPAIVSNPGANNAGVLTMTLPSLIDVFGYGYALQGTGTILNGTTLSLFNGATPVGSLSFTATPDLVFPGGFAGVRSTLPFNRVEATFNSVSAASFALDNIRRGPAVAAVPEPTTVVLLGTGLLAVMRVRARRKTAVS
jgi:PEP-CTERM motif